jgi:hypothetical protein
MTSTELAALIESLPSIAEQRAIQAHNKPIIEALSTAVVQAQRLFGRNTTEYLAACRVFDAATSANTKKL